MLCHHRFRLRSLVVLQLVLHLRVVIISQRERIIVDLGQVKLDVGARLERDWLFLLSRMALKSCFAFVAGVFFDFLKHLRRTSVFLDAA